MRFLAALGLLCLLAAGSSARAQVEVGAQLERSQSSCSTSASTLLVTLTNNTESDVVLDNEANHPWLSFLVCKHNHLPVRPERNGTFNALGLKAGRVEDAAHQSHPAVLLPRGGRLHRAGGDRPLRHRPDRLAGSALRGAARPQHLEPDAAGQRLGARLLADPLLAQAGHDRALPARGGPEREHRLRQHRPGPRSSPTSTPTSFSTRAATSTCSSSSP